jgi:uncharacterized protein YdhG (YjbR/CyaY superfamily)
LTARTLAPQHRPMSAADIDAYLDALDEPKRTTLRKLRETILRIIPDAEQCISYRIPAFRVGGQVVAGFAAFSTHCSYFPFSGSVLGELSDDLSAYAQTKSALHFPIDAPLTAQLVERLIAVRMDKTPRRPRASKAKVTPKPRTAKKRTPLRGR